VKDDRSLDIAVPADDAELARFGAIASRSLGFPLERLPFVLQGIGAANFRVARRGGELAGGLGLLPMGQWFGGRSVRCVGVSVVAVSPEHRSRGIGSAMMRVVLEEMHREGVPLSTLYPATFPVYRAAGYETAGNRVVYRLTIPMLGAGTREPEVRAATADDRATVRTLHQAHARTLSGQIDRSDFMWKRVLDPFAEEANTYVVEGRSGPEGYIVLSRKPGGAPLAPMEMVVRDAVARTHAAATRLVRLLSDHRSIARYALLPSGPCDPLMTVMNEERFEVVEMLRWMTRVVHVRAALEARGWSPVARAELHLDVRDALLPENARRWTLEVSDGRAEVREGGRGSLAVDVRGLAALYTGHLTAEQLRVAGLCDGPDDELATASALFAGPPPWTTDFF
jgi:predicted acetyltransferase